MTYEEAEVFSKCTDEEKELFYAMIGDVVLLFDRKLPNGTSIRDQYEKLSKSKKILLRKFILEVLDSAGK